MRKHMNSQGNDLKNYLHNPSTSLLIETSQNIKTIVRVRPFLKNEFVKYNTVFHHPVDENKIKLSKDSQVYEASFDKVFSMFSKQNDVFNYTKEAFSQLLIGFNCTLFTYGQTNSGKTYTMFGADWTNYEKTDLNYIEGMKKYDFVINPFSEENGIIIRALNYIFDEIDSSGKGSGNTIYCSFLQIYNEKIYDILNDDDDVPYKHLTIREDPTNGIYIEGLSEYIVFNVYECLNILKRGEKFRKKRTTKRNQLSSRSHTIFTLIVENNKVKMNGKLKRSKLNLCDLAGSEKYDTEGNMNEDHFNEMCNINLSLYNLGNVINSLSTKQKHIPYRDSKLTRILQDSLGGNTLTYLICNISPDINCYDESVNTLKFGDRAKSIMQKVRPNEILAYDENLIRRLQTEINSLKEILNIRKKRGQFNKIENELLRLKVENDRLKEIMKSNHDLESLLNENKKLKLEIQQMRINGINNEKDSVHTINTEKLSVEDKAFTNKTKSSQETAHSINYYKTDLNDENPYYQLSDKKMFDNKHNILFNYPTIKSPFNMNSNRSRSDFKDIPSNQNKNKFGDEQLKSSNQRLKLLERLEEETNRKLMKEIENIQNMSLKRQENKFRKELERREDLQRIEGHMNRIKYLYNDNTNCISGINSPSFKRHINSKSLSKYKRNNDSFKIEVDKKKDNFEIKKNKRNFYESNNKIESLNDYEIYLRNSLN